MKTFNIIFLLIGLGMIAGGFIKGQEGTIGVGILFLIFTLICNRLTIQRRDVV